jgi:hypothetical protein
MSFDTAKPITLFESLTFQLFVMKLRMFQIEMIWKQKQFTVNIVKS